MVDEDGFQQVKNRKNTRRNIFDTVNDEMRSNAFALAEEVRAARHRNKPHDGEASRRGGGHADQEEGISEKHKENVQAEDIEMRLQSEEQSESP